MFKASFVYFFVITLITQFHFNYGIDWVGFIERLVFGSNNNLQQVSVSRLLEEGENAEKRYIDNEIHIVSKPKIIKAQLEQNTDNINRWYDYHKTANFFMRYIAEYVMDWYFEDREKLYEQLEEAKENIDLEPFCHYRYHNTDSETDMICRKVFQNHYFQQQKWFLDDDGQKHCSRVSVSRIKKNEHDRHSKLSYYREARRCAAYMKKEETETSKKIHFSVYLISHEAYLRTKRMSYFVLLNHDIAQTEKKKIKRILRYLFFWEEKHVQVKAYIES